MSMSTNDTPDFQPAAATITPSDKSEQEPSSLGVLRRNEQNAPALDNALQMSPSGLIRAASLQLDIQQQSKTQILAADRIEISGHHWWEVNVDLILEGPGTAAEKAEALQQLGPTTELGDRVLIDRDGNVTKLTVERAQRGLEMASSPRRADPNDGKGSPGIDMETDRSSGQAGQRDLMLKAAEQIQGQVAALQERLDHTALDSYVARLQLSKEVRQLSDFASQIQAAAAPSKAMDLSRQQIGGSPDPQGNSYDASPGIKKVPFLQTERQERQLDLSWNAPAMAALGQAGIETNHEFSIVDPPSDKQQPRIEEELEIDEGHEL